MSSKIEVRRMNEKGQDAFLSIVRAKETDILKKVDEYIDKKRDGDDMNACRIHSNTSA